MTVAISEDSCCLHGSTLTRFTGDSRFIVAKRWCSVGVMVCMLGQIVFLEQGEKAYGEGMKKLAWENI